jgi:hypothetical protein
MTHQSPITVSGYARIDRGHLDELGETPRTGEAELIIRKVNFYSILQQ